MRGRAGVPLRSGRPALLGLLGLLASGCSFIFVEGPPTKQAQPEERNETEQVEELDCTTSQAAPVVDSLIAGFQVVRTGFALAADEGDYRNAPIPRGADIGFGVALTALFVGSAAYGFVTTGKCADAKALVAEREWASPVDSAVVAPVAAPTRPALSDQPQCTHDAECSGLSICERGMCVPDLAADPSGDEVGR